MRWPQPITRLALTGAIVLGSAAVSPAPVRACGWDYETYHAEARSMPCVFDALMGYWPKHTDAYHERRLEAFALGLAWMPDWTEALDAQGISLLKLGRLPEAEVVMKHRLRVAPDAYASHANLGTLFTFTGAYDDALRHIDRAMAIEPAAHFGREQYHRDLVDYLRRGKADPKVFTTETFVGIAPTPNQRAQGSKALWTRLGVKDDAVDALVAMLTVYGADELAEVYFALGELLATRGNRRLAYTAYRRAKELGHPRKATAKRAMADIDAALRKSFYKGTGSDGYRRGFGPVHRQDIYRGIGRKYPHERGEAKKLQREYAAWETGQLAKGLPVWTQAGLDKIYAHMHDVRRRCKAPRIIDDPLAPPAGQDPSAGLPEAGIGVAPAAKEEGQ